MSIETPQSNVENYLGVLIDQEGAVEPLIPQSRVEEYLRYIIENNIGKLTVGYLYDGHFYKDTAHTQLIDPVENCLYLDLTSGGLYYYNGTSYVAIASGGGGGSVISVNGKTGAVVIRGTDVAMSETDTRTVKEAIDAVETGMTYYKSSTEPAAAKEGDLWKVTTP